MTDRHMKVTSSSWAVIGYFIDDIFLIKYLIHIITLFKATTEHVTLFTELNPQISTEPLSSAAASTVILFVSLKLVQSELVQLN
ncbi:hypothetical protein EB796_004173 [Bugula neritina]|uniref:Uncharacterized protein n=1 Tax=Bugula neritina TaxID=10212 RepID=A0A7J7KFZ5_BUGNE|nr:hypothetical protein EB796_004173 [Bugula neritina]